MLITEMFSSIQGEGSSQGKNSLFIRFPSCNLSCSVCDSKYTWKAIEKTDIPRDEVWTQVRNHTNIVFTGGEPLLKRNWDEIKEITTEYRHKQFEVETNGTILIDDEDNLMNKQIQFNISPKLNVQQEKPNDLEPVLITQIRTINQKYPSIDYIVKFLFSKDEDFEFIHEQAQKYKIPASKIWIQPIGTDPGTIKEIALTYFDQIIKLGWNLSLRSHIYLFGNRRNV